MKGRKLQLKENVKKVLFIAVQYKENWNRNLNLTEIGRKSTTLQKGKQKLRLKENIKKKVRLKVNRNYN